MQIDKILDVQRRFYRKEKNRFLDAVEEKLTEYGYEFERKKFGRIVKSINLETKSTQPEYLFIAHYDTGTIMPFWFSWLMSFFGVNNQLLILIPLCFFSALSELHVAFGIVYLIIFISFLTILIPNRKNFDDNTSGVIALLLLAKKCKENGIENVKFLFVDNEEWGLIGSRRHRKYLRKKRLITPNCKVISIDCVGVGKFPLIIRNNKSNYADFFEKEFQNNYECCKSLRMIMPFSDNFSFKKYGALNISFVNKATIPGGYTIPNIHSSKDNSIDINQIEKLTDVLADIVVKKITL